MTAPAEVGRTLDSPLPASVAGDREREAMSLALVGNRRFDIADLDDEEFQAGLDKLRRRQERMQQILETSLIEDVHYGNPKVGTGANAKRAFQKPMLYQAGAEELQKLFRFSVRPIKPNDIIATEDFVSVTVTLGCYDLGGNLLSVRSGSCTSVEGRFKRRDGKGFTYRDAREILHPCAAMAEKRAHSFAVRAATGATGFFAAEEEMAEALAETDEPEALPPLTEADAQNFLLPGDAKAWSGHGGKPLSAIRDSFLKAIGDWCVKQLEADEEDRIPKRLLEAVRLVQKAREEGRAKQPPKPAGTTPVNPEGYEGQDA